MNNPSSFIFNIFSELLWIAPEVLPLTVTPGSTATQKGDVYSFAIILEEIVVRGGPYMITRTFMTAQEVWSVSSFYIILVLLLLLFYRNLIIVISFIPKIVNRVSASENPPLRPEVDPKDCPPDILSLMEKCWHEIPEERPSFHTIRGTIAGIMKYICDEKAFGFFTIELHCKCHKSHFRGYCENLMDDLLRRMEQYANNLEALVEEKTEQLSLEKRRSEELLYQVLPR